MEISRSRLRWQHSERISQWGQSAREHFRSWLPSAGQMLAVRCTGMIARLRRSKSPVAAPRATGAISTNNTEMVRSVRSQAANVGSNRPVRVSGLTLCRRAVSVKWGGRAVLEINGRAQPMRIQ